MTSNVSNNTTTIIAGFIYRSSAKENRIKFAILLTLQLLSIPCFLYIFFQFHTKRQFYHSHHHVILLLLSVSFLFVIIAVPLTEAYLYVTHVYPANKTFCSLWNWIHYSLNITNLFLMAFASIARNWLVFHAWLVRSKRGKVLFHYCPLLFCLFYPSIFYIAAIFIHPCRSYYDYTQLLCKWPCYFHNRNWTNVDIFLNNYAPLYVIPVFCSIIYVRVFLQKRAFRQQLFKWRRDRKMILQLWAISSLYLVMWVPLQLLALINLYWDPTFLIQAQIDYLYLFPYLIHLIYPFIVLLTYRKEMLNFTQRNLTTQALAYN